jgi:plastocyanin
MSRRFCLVVGIAALAVLTMAWPARPATPALVTAFNVHFVPNTVTLDRGAELQFFNADAAGRLESLGHTLTEYRSDGPPRFETSLVQFGAVAPAGVAALPQGTYTFFCQVHPFMKGTLFIR